MILFDEATAADVLDALRLLEGRRRQSGRGLSAGALELRTMAQATLSDRRRQLGPRGESVADDAEVTHLLTLSDVAGQLQVSIRAAQRLVADGALPAARFGDRTVRVRQEDLDSFVAAHVEPRGDEGVEADRVAVAGSGPRSLPSSRMELAR